MTGPKVPQPRQLAAEARRHLKAQAAHWPARRATTFFKPEEEVYTIGLSTPKLRQIERRLAEAVRGAWGYPEAVEFADLMLRERYLEARSLGLMLLARYHAELPPEFLNRARDWLAAGRLDNWALTDQLGTKLLAPLLQRQGALAEKLKDWVGSRNLWLRRAALVALVPLARRGLHLALAYSIVTKLQSDSSDLIQKAAGWLLRECGTTNPRRLATYLAAHGPRVPRTTLRYAIERLPKPQRDDLLQRTRGAGTPA
jgi:3-methyladenine DNA glycosylase AlkD